ncbi:MAG: MOSC domain-containing protein [Thermoplasmata archaeon]|nr:MOSC domain-containing protein [Thermoplasmata archaeon]MCI4359753.1 MOSC domain-containing protein [Thermoplasmata archaeon]
MHVVSLNVGKIETFLWEGRPIRTGFRKHPTEGRVALVGVNLRGDDQADRSVHGGRRKAVYVYPSEHYRFWREELELPSLEWGAFGENLTTVGWLESTAHIGDVVRIGNAKLEVTQPRSPCYKMNATFGRADMIERFNRSGRSGFYLAPIEEGDIGRGDPVELISRTVQSPSIVEVLAKVASRGSAPGDTEN